MIISKMMRLHRATSDKDQKAIAMDIGIPAKTLSRLEGGKSIDQSATIKVIAWLFGDGADEDEKL